MGRQYATPTDLTEWTGDAAPADAAALIRHASALVEGATRGARYAVDDGGLPTGPAVVAAFRDATCAQVALWAAAGLDPTTGGIEATSGRVATSKTIRGATVSYDAAAAAQAKQARTAALTSVGAETYQILDNAGLIVGSVQ